MTAFSINWSWAHHFSDQSRWTSNLARSLQRFKWPETFCHDVLGAAPGLYEYEYDIARTAGGEGERRRFRRSLAPELRERARLTDLLLR